MRIDQSSRSMWENLENPWLKQYLKLENWNVFHACSFFAGVWFRNYYCSISHSILDTGILLHEDCIGIAQKSCEGENNIE